MKILKTLPENKQWRKRQKNSIGQLDNWKN